VYVCVRRSGRPGRERPHTNTQSEIVEPLFFCHVFRRNKKARPFVSAFGIHDVSKQTDARPRPSAYGAHAKSAIFCGDSSADADAAGQTTRCRPRVCFRTRVLLFLGLAFSLAQDLQQIKRGRINAPVRAFGLFAGS
jgi:hypothetical protein